MSVPDVVVKEMNRIPCDRFNFTCLLNVFKTNYDAK